MKEKEEEGIGTASDVVKVKSQDPAPLGCLREDRARGTSAILNRGCLLPWYACEETPGP